METCKWFNVCPLRKFEKEGKISGKWRDEYCKTERNWINCKRYQMEREGKTHPDNMLPDGKIDEDLE